MIEVSTSTLCKRHDPNAFTATVPEPVAETVSLVGQDRSREAIQLSASIRHDLFNLFVTGPAGSGRHAEVLGILREHAADRPVPVDWVYVNNFDDPQKPRALELPAGKAIMLRDCMQKLVDDLANDIPALFESDEYQSQRRLIEEEVEQSQETAMAEFADRAQSENIALLRTPMGFMLTAIREGKPLKTEDYGRLPEQEQAEVDEKIARFQEQLAEVMREAPKLERQGRNRIEQLNADMAERAVSARIEEVATELRGIESVASYLTDAQADIIANAELFLKSGKDRNDGPFPEAIRKYHQDPEFGRYAINVMVSHAENGDLGAPVEMEDLPTLDRLTGRIEHVSHMGSLMTNFTMIKPGALHRANGGYLILDARRVLVEPFAWDALKRCLKNRRITITSLAERISLASTITLEPDPIPLSVRVVLVGDRVLHALLVMFDPDFAELFKVQADFEESVDRNGESSAGMSGLLASQAARENLRPLNAAGMARLLDEAVRIAEDSRKYSLRVEALTDLMCEADHYASQRSADVIDAADIAAAVDAQDRRASRIRDRMHEAITRGTILIDTSGEKVGQVNGLSVIGLGDYVFGRPSRITARVRMGAGKLIDIEREVELGGPLHSKGVMILSGYLAATFALDVPFSLHASLVFEQSYGGVDGDSASSTELYALLSALSGLPIDQGVAVTGSVNQAGEVQAIGGVNQKIEGFFDICAAKGLSGKQGVIIPKTNIDHLMLRPRVVEAVAAGMFRILAVETVEEGIEALTGVPAGKRGPDGAFEAGSVYARVEERLRDFAEQRRKFGRNKQVNSEEGTR
ncbi:Lon protease family protein [Aliiruegeria lutimaris]|uniref:endopeptidase La n=1 Tax=Aliiruegeria lutimaris TaxID=571298 RepID=A0A1G8YLG8_9RHOB|nr:ATP-binding protein [Aliiruegeria lutimaris]SDK03005.1 Predicted ATP-dependent protease [Aliiruegeria lutimaris]